MKIIATIGFTLLMSGAVMSQEIDERLLVKYDQKELAEMQTSNPSKLEMLVYALDNAIYFANYDYQKGDLNEINYSDENATFLDLGLEITNQNQYFKVPGNAKVLVVKSEWVLNHEMENNK